jgi:hypothetical protein
MEERTMKTDDIKQYKVDFEFNGDECSLTFSDYVKAYNFFGVIKEHSRHTILTKIYSEANLSKGTGISINTKEEIIREHTEIDKIKERLDALEKLSNR